MLWNYYIIVKENNKQKNDIDDNECEPEDDVDDVVSKFEKKVDNIKHSTCPKNDFYFVI